MSGGKLLYGRCVQGTGMEPLLNFALRWISVLVLTWPFLRKVLESRKAFIYKTYENSAIPYQGPEGKVDGMNVGSLQMPMQAENSNFSEGYTGADYV